MIVLAHNELRVNKSMSKRESNLLLMSPRKRSILMKLLGVYLSNYLSIYLIIYLLVMRAFLDRSDRGHKKREEQIQLDSSLLKMYLSIYFSMVLLIY
jgi:hypothetical protein